MKFGAVFLVAACACACAAEKWQWPEGAASVRIDTKVRFIDDAHTEHNHKDHVQADEPQFEEPRNTEGFYNRPPGAGRYPVRVEPHRQPYRVNNHGVYSVKKTPAFYSDGTLDSLQYCKCVSSPECNPSPNSAKACGVGKFLCCYKRPNQNHQHSEYFNEVEDERPVLLPNRDDKVGPFPPPPDTALGGLFGPGGSHGAAVIGNAQPVLVGPQGPTGSIGPKKPVLVGPEGPTGIIGPAPNRGVLVGPEGPTGVIGPGDNRGVLVGPDGPTGIVGPNRGVLVGPEGPTGVIGPGHNRDFYPDPEGNNNRGVLVGPGGPTGIVGPGNKNVGYLTDNHDPSESAQRGVLVGPGGPTGIIGPGGYGRRPVLVGPGGPTGIIGPYGPYGRMQRPAVLVGPGGPTGMIGPPRRPYYGK